MTDCQGDHGRRQAAQKELMRAGIPVLRVHRVDEPEHEGEPMLIAFEGREKGDPKSTAKTAYVRHGGEPAVVDGWDL